MRDKTTSYQTLGDVIITCHTKELANHHEIEKLIDCLDEQRGVLLTSGYEYPGRYSRWDIGFINPPIAITAKNRDFRIVALNQRGEILLAALTKTFSQSDYIADFQAKQQTISGTIKRSEQHFSEEYRSKQNSIFSLLRTITQLFYSEHEANLGLYGAFGYDLALQFEALQLQLPREAQQRDLVLYIPDEIYIVDHQSRYACIKQYDFEYAGQTTKHLPRDGAKTSFKTRQEVPQNCDHAPGAYAENVAKAKEAFRCGDLFEVVLSQTFYEPCTVKPSEIFRRLRKKNPAPYASFMNLGEGEYLVGASPEMFVRVTGKRIETCPISGTIARGKDAITDAQQILTLLNSQKDESELTMCTDVDRNDKSRICEPGSVRVIGRRQIEMYSRVIHTVDHVEGILRAEFDALDAFLSHTWVVTVTGAPKIWAMQFIEDHEKTARRWYGGAIGWLQFNGDINTGLTLRTMRIQNGVAEVRVGATLLYDSDPEAEEQETVLKASAFIDAIRNPAHTESEAKINFADKPGKNKHILLVDHQDSFVHTLANYLRQTGAQVSTLRAGFLEQDLIAIKPDLMVLSPGPGNPDDFNLKNTIALALQRQLPIFGVCLGLQGIVEYFKGELNILDYPMHGKPSKINVLGGKLFADLPKQFIAARYHSLHANKEKFPQELIISAESEDGVVMAIEHKTLPIAAVQFHPESILSLENQIGMQIIYNVMRLLT